MSFQPIKGLLFYFSRSIKIVNSDEIKLFNMTLAHVRRKSQNPMLFRWVLAVVLSWKDKMYCEVTNIA